MRMSFPLAALLGFFFLTGSCLGAEPGPLVFLDPGHGGADRGVAAEGFDEAAFNHKMARKVARLLVQGGARPQISHEEKIGVSTTTRVLAANHAHPAAAVSIHFNFSYGKNSGCRVFVPALPARSSAASAGGVSLVRWDRLQALRLGASKQLGQSLAGELEKAQPVRRGVQAVPLAFFKGMMAPAALVECGFASSPADLAALKDDSRVDALSAAIAKGILNFLELSHAR